MESNDVDFVMRVLQAHTVALCALLATHPDVPALREAFDAIAQGLDADPETLATLRQAIP